MNLWYIREQEAKRRYEAYVDKNPYMHSNRSPSWYELQPDQRKLWYDKNYRK